MRCLEKDRRRRYETANALASDLQRHLQNEPVVARPPSAVYRIQKMVTRNRGLVLATAAIAMTLVLALGFSTAALMRERSARTQAQLAELARKEAKQLGEAEAVRADSVSRFVGFDDVIPTLHRMGQRESIQRLLEIADRLAGGTSRRSICGSVASACRSDCLRRAAIPVQVRHSALFGG